MNLHLLGLPVPPSLCLRGRVARRRAPRQAVGGSRGRPLLPGGCRVCPGRRALRRSPTGPAEELLQRHTGLPAPSDPASSRAGLPGAAWGVRTAPRPAARHRAPIVQHGQSADALPAAANRLWGPRGEVSTALPPRGRCALTSRRGPAGRARGGGRGPRPARRG